MHNSFELLSQKNTPNLQYFSTPDRFDISSAQQRPGIESPEATPSE